MGDPHRAHTNDFLPPDSQIFVASVLMARGDFVLADTLNTCQLAFSGAAAHSDKEKLTLRASLGASRSQVLRAILERKHGAGTDRRALGTRPGSGHDQKGFYILAMPGTHCLLKPMCD